MLKSGAFLGKVQLTYAALAKPEAKCTASHTAPYPREEGARMRALLFGDSLVSRVSEETIPARRVSPDCDPLAAPSSIWALNAKPIGIFLAYTIVQTRLEGNHRGSPPSSLDIDRCRSTSYRRAETNYSWPLKGLSGKRVAINKKNPSLLRVLCGSMSRRFSCRGSMGN